MFPILKKYYFIYDVHQISSNKYHLQIGSSKQTKFVLEGDSSIFEILSLCDGKHELDEICRIISKKYTLDSQKVRDNIYSLVDAKIIVDNIDYPKDLNPARYSRQLTFLSIFNNECADHLNIRNKKVALIGMGGIGCWILANLASCGVYQFIGIDDDIIELSNLSRQILYTESDIGSYKVDCAKKWLNKYNSECSFEAIKKKITSTQDIENYIDNVDMVVVSADSPLMLRYCHNACKNKNIPYIQVGYLDEIGSCGPLTTDFSINIEKTLASTEITDPSILENINNVNSRTITAVLCPVVSQTACYASKQIIKYFMGYRDMEVINQRVLFNFNNDEKTILKFD